MSKYLLLLILIPIHFNLAAARPDPPIVSIPLQGDVAGVELANMRIHKILGYFGIPYAQPPIGPLRFEPPSTNPPPLWEGTRLLTSYADSCLQTEDGHRPEDVPFMDLFRDYTRAFNTSEDCLYLNVFTPAGPPPPEAYPVIVWIHPGNFTTGTPAMWNPHTLVHRQRVVVVTFAYRLNVIGFFTTMDGEAPGNFGLMDQQAALKWVSKNIRHFNGNPDNIVLMGAGAGGISVGVHMANPETRKLFHKAIIMSADFLGDKVYRKPKEDLKLLDRLAESFGCIRRPTSQLMDCLRAPDGPSLVKFTSHVNWRPLIDAGFSNSTDPVIPEHPRSAFKKGDFADIPLLIGYTQMEQVLAVESLQQSDTGSGNITKERLQEIFTELVTRDLPAQPTSEEIAESGGGGGGEVDGQEFQDDFQDDEEDPEGRRRCPYNQDQIMDAVKFFYTPSPSGPAALDLKTFRRIIADFTTEKSYGAPTYNEASLVAEKGAPVFMYRFDIRPSSPAVLANVPEWVTVPHLFDLLYVWGVPYWRHDADYDPRDKRIADAVMSFWTNFAKHGEPTRGAIYPIRWERFTKEKPGLLLIDSSFAMSDDGGGRVNYKAFEFWNEYFPKVLRAGSKCCGSNAGSPIVSRAVLPVLVAFMVIGGIFWQCVLAPNVLL